MSSLRTMWAVYLSGKTVVWNFSENVHDDLQHTLHEKSNEKAIAMRPGTVSPGCIVRWTERRGLSICELCDVIISQLPSLGPLGRHETWHAVKRPLNFWGPAAKWQPRLICQDGRGGEKWETLFFRARDSFFFKKKETLWRDGATDKTSLAFWIIGKVECLKRINFSPSRKLYRPCN